MLAQLWTAESIEALLDVLARSRDIRSPEVIHELHAQAMECERTAPEVSAQLDRVAGQLTELHAALRGAESLASLDELLRWQAEAPWRMSGAMQRLLAAVAAKPEPAAWPWALEPLTRLQAELDRRAATSSAPTTSSPTPFDVLAELIEPWHRLDAGLERACQALAAEVVAGRRSLADALSAVDTDAAGAPSTNADHTAASIHRRSSLLLHLLEDASPAMRRAALVAHTRMLSSPEAHGLEPRLRLEWLLRWATALDLGWSVLPDPAAAFEGALRLLDQARAAAAELPAQLHRDATTVCARILRRLAGWRDAMLEPAIAAHERALEALDPQPAAGAMGRVLGDLAVLLAARRSDEPQVQDQAVRATFEEALVELRGSVVLRARALADYAAYLGRPRHASSEDPELALALAHEAVALLEGLPAAARGHPWLRIEEATHRMTLSNLRLELGEHSPSERWVVCTRELRRALECVGDHDEVLVGAVHLGLALAVLGTASAEHRAEQLEEATHWLARAASCLGPLPVLHGRALAELAMLTMLTAPEDERARDDLITEVESALQRLPLGSDPSVRARVQSELGKLLLHRDGPDDLVRAAEHFAAARTAFVEGGEVRLAAEAARDFAECQLRQHADGGDPTALVRGVVVLEQASLLAEQRWAARGPDDSPDDPPDEPLAELSATLSDMHGDLAWLQAKLGRPVEQLLHHVTRAKHLQAPTLRALERRAERSSLLRPMYLDALARRSSPPVLRRSTPCAAPAPARARARALAFAAANPEVLVLDLTLTRWGTVVVAVSPRGLDLATIPLSQATVRRWIWGEPSAPGWWAHYLAHRRALAADDVEAAAAHERAWIAAGARLAADLGMRLLEPLSLALGIPLADRTLLLAPGRLDGLPLAAARVAGEPLVVHVKGLARIASLAELPPGPLPDPRPHRALCVLADPRSVEAETSVALEELHDVVRLLASARAEVEVLARLGTTEGASLLRSAPARTRERASVSPEAPTIEAVLRRAPRVDHVFHGGQGRTDGLFLLDEEGRPTQLDGAMLEGGPRWAPGSSVLVSAASRCAPPAEDRPTWDLVRSLHRAGVTAVIIAPHAVPPTLARDVSRGLYLYWALGRSLVEASTAALANVAGSDPSRIGAFVVSLGAMDEPPAADAPTSPPAPRG